MSLITNVLQMVQRAFSESVNVKRTRPRNRMVPCLEILEERIVLSNYYWSPDPNLEVNNENLVSGAGNWRSGRLANSPLMTQAPGANDKLIFTALGSAVLDPAASNTYAAITFTSGCSLRLRQGVTFTGTDGSQTGMESTISGGTIYDPQLADRTVTFSGSPLSLSAGSFEQTVNLVNAAENEINMSGGGGYFLIGSKLVNNGTINWTEGAWEVDASTIENSGCIDITAWNGATIQPGETGLSDFDNLNGGTINISGQIAVNIGVKRFTNAGTLNFTGESTTTFKVNEFIQTAGAIDIGDNSVVDVQVEEGGDDGSGTMTVNGGSVGGSGTIKATLQIGQATIRPGTSTAAGVLNVQGNVNMGGQTQTSIIIAGNNTNSQLAVTGTVALGGTLTVAIPNGVNINANQSWTIITGQVQQRFAAGGVTQPAGFSAPTYNAQSVQVQNPVMNSCGPQTTNENAALVFSAANNNLISIPDAAAATALLQITLTATNGTLTLSGTSGLTFSSGTGTGDTSMTFVGAISGINAALNGFVYKPNTNFYGSASLTITTTDTPASGGSYSDNHTVSITVNAGPPVAQADSYSVSQGQMLMVTAASGVLHNDSDPGNDPLTAVLVSTTAHGSLSLSSNGSFAYSPNTGFVGVDSYTYKAFDGVEYSNVVTVTIQVISSGPPLAMNDSYTDPHGQMLTVSAASGVLHNDNDPG